MTVQSANLLVIFGATGDLAQRMLLPSLYGLQRDGLLPPHLRILCTGRSVLDDAQFAHTVTEAVERRVAASERDPTHLAALLARIRYQPAALDDAASLATLCNTICQMRDGEIVYHLSTAPRFYAQICAALGAANLAGPGTRVMLEKPIGHDLDSSVEINEGVGSVFAEERIFRVDHYLGKEGVQNLLALRFGNALFEPLWNARHIAQVQITVAETVGVEGRGDYYDHSGAMRDMLQNHLLQLLCLTAMEPPSQFDPSAVRNEKLKVLRSLRPIEASDAASHSVAGQYTAGAIEGVAVPGYRDELGRSSGTETFVALRAHVDNWRWSGVPFYLRTGKRLPSRCTEIWLQFRAVPHSIFGSEARIEPNALLIQLQPEERISLTLMSKTPGLDRSGLKFSQVALDLDLHDAFEEVRKRTAYERLYLDALEGNGTLFVRRDETEAAWQWVDGIFNAWKEAGMTPKNYPAGTWGPASSVALIERHGHSWRE
ncbi:MAG TPA: glucose-6-phosphate dehydrogenase [Xanthomonadales bacterium]|nr:glucose-6-phosphate dehydrogenase [Xanthomonadales bacterium]